MSQTPPFKVFSGTNSRYLAEKICNSLGCELGQMNIQHFADGEFAVSFEESIRGCQVYLVQSTFPNSDNLMELLLMIDAAKRASAKSIVAVVPYFGWARQDRKDKPRVSIAAKLLADILSVAGINRLITMDLHADQIQGFFDVPVDHLYASSVFIPYIQSLKLKDMVVATPDVGGSKRASTYAKYLGVPLVLCHKQRAKANVVESMTVMSRGALSVRAIASHAVMSDPASERVQNSSMTELIFTDSIPYTKKCDKVHILSIADLFADTIRRVYENKSISSQYLL